MKTPITPQGLPVRDLTDDEKQFLHYNPNTSDLVEFVQAYAREALAAQAAALQASRQPQAQQDWALDVEALATKERS